MKRLKEIEIKAEMKTIEPSWTKKGKFICREFYFENFIEAFSFMTSVAFWAEKLNHHPNWENVYNQVKVNLSTHEVDGLTQKDFELAREIDQLYYERKRR